MMLNPNVWYPGSMQMSSSWSSTIFQLLSPVLGLSAVASVVSGERAFDSRLLLFGFVVELGRRLSQWVMERFQFRFNISAQFNDGDPAYDWVIFFLTKQNVYRRTMDFRVLAKSSKRQWSMNTVEETCFVGRPDEHAEYIPNDGPLQVFRWKGYLVEATKSGSQPYRAGYYDDGPPTHSIAGIKLTIYSWNMKALTEFVDAARVEFLAHSKKEVTVHTPMGTGSYRGGTQVYWTDVKRKPRRSLNSLVLEGKVLDMLVQDAREYLSMEEWYADACIPYRRGYLLYGPPGTGKTSTIYAVASELGMEIYSLSLAASNVDDSFLQQAANSIPKNSIFLIEDIDCAFPTSREDENDSSPFLGAQSFRSPFLPPMAMGRTSMVTLSGLLNVLDGVGSEEGKLFFATTNYIDRLDSALIRPGRIDMKIEYKLATQSQARALFTKFYSFKHISGMVSEEKGGLPSDKPSFDLRIGELAQAFCEQVPDHKFSTAEIQGYLLHYKRDPERASRCVTEWVEKEQRERDEKARMAKEKKDKAKALYAPAPLLGPFPPVYPPTSPPSADTQPLHTPRDTPDAEVKSELPTL